MPVEVGVKELVAKRAPSSHSIVLEVSWNYVLAQIGDFGVLDGLEVFRFDVVLASEIHAKLSIEYGQKLKTWLILVTVRNSMGT